MNRQEAKDAKKRKREEQKKEKTKTNEIGDLRFSSLFSLVLFLASLASWRFIWIVLLKSAFEIVVEDLVGRLSPDDSKQPPHDGS